MSDGTELLDAFDDDLPAAGGRAWDLSRRLRRYLPALAVFVGGLVLWEGLVRGLDVEEFLLPAPSVILSTFFEELDVVGRAGWATFKEAIGGFVVGTVAGALVALATARWTAVKEGVLPFAIAANSAPIIAVAPITNQWFGITDPLSKMAVVALIVFFPVMINTVRGLTQVDPREVELLRSMAASKFEIVRRVRVPNALPYVFSALKVASALSVIAAIVAEYFGGPRNTLGVYITQQAALFRFAEAWAAILVGTILGVAFYAAVVTAERLVMPWHVSLRTTET